MLKDKMLFIFKRYIHNNNKILTFKNLSFLSKTSFIIITRSFKSIIKNESNKIRYKLFQKHLKEKKIDINI